MPRNLFGGHLVHHLAVDFDFVGLDGPVIVSRSLALFCFVPLHTLFMIEPRGMIKHDDLRKGARHRVLHRPVIRLAESLD